MTDRSNASRLNRRTFIKTSAVAGAALTTWRPTFGSGGFLEKLNFASVGVSGMGETDLSQVAAHSDTVVVALCDVDRNRLTAANNMYTGSEAFVDYREMFDKMGDKIDAVTITTPDHMHAPVCMTALNSKKHVYCQKPLAHSIHECRAIRKAAAANPELATQMGTQNASLEMKQRAMQALRNGMCGRIVEIVALTDRAKGWWPQGEPRPTGSDPVPEHIEWDLWLGVAEKRPYMDLSLIHI